jgi:hypothetical protein
MDARPARVLLCRRAGEPPERRRKKAGALLPSRPPVRAGRVLRGLAGHQWSPELEKETLWVGPFLKKKMFKICSIQHSLKNIDKLSDLTFFCKIYFINVDKMLSQHF